MTKIYVPITDEEFVMLSQKAFRNCRHPREQARHFIRQALGLVDDGPSLETNNRRDAKTLTERNVTAAGEIYP